MDPKTSSISNTHNLTFYADITSTTIFTTICYVMVCVCLRSSTLNYLNIFSTKIALDSPKIMYLVTYKIFYNALMYARSVKVNNQNT